MDMEWKQTVKGVADMLGGVVFDFDNPTFSQQKLMELLKPDPTPPPQTENDKTNPRDHQPPLASQ